MPLPFSKMMHTGLESTSFGLWNRSIVLILYEDKTKKLPNCEQKNTFQEVVAFLRYCRKLERFYSIAQAVKEQYLIGINNLRNVLRRNVSQIEILF